MLFKKYDICVFGGCSIDFIYYEKSDGKYNENPDEMVPGGKGSNQAVAASRAGAKVTIISKIGNDDIGKIILNNLQENGVFTNNVEVIDGLTNDVSKIYIEKESKDNKIIREQGAINSFTPDMVEKYKDVILNSKIVIAQTKIPQEVTVKLIDFCYDNDIPIIITPSSPEKLNIAEKGNKELIDKITIITANKKECSLIFNTDNIEECVTKYSNKLIVTLGGDGVMYHDGKEIIHIDALKIENLVDTVGAGDTLNGNLGYLLTKNYNLKSAITKSQYASAIKLGVRSAQKGMPYADQLEDFIFEYNNKKSAYYEEFALAYKTILKASELIKNKSQLKVTKKNDKTFVTESDLLVENLFIDAIKEKYPDDNFVTEETYSKNLLKDRTWIIDPIDGTSHYMKNSIFWGIQVAFIDKEEAQFSIIYIPKLNEMYYQTTGNGVFLNGEKISLAHDAELDKCIVEFCGSLYKNYDEKKKILKKIILEDEKVSNVLHINSCCFAFANFISGRTDAIVLSTKKMWDILPGIFMLMELGIKPINIGNMLVFTKSKELVQKIIEDE